MSEMRYTYSLLQVDSLKSQHAYLEKQLDSLKDASKPSNDELETLKKLAKMISVEENEIARITQSSKNLKEKVRKENIYQLNGYQFFLRCQLYLFFIY